MKQLVIILNLFFLHSCFTESVTVSTTLGDVTGSIIQVEDQGAEAYIGIPYAKPPTGELRFLPPVQAEPWTGAYEANKLASVCVQAELDVYSFRDSGLKITTPISEDCLYLNVWTPSSKDDKLRPVMVWIHGGGFFSGSASLKVYDGSILSALNDVVVVSVNYRLGIFGFLHAGTEGAPGNVGLLDQRMAIMWVRENIKNFGGDPDLITVFGESAGSMSTNLQVLSPLNKGLFKRTILMSGTNYVTCVTDPPHVSLLKGNNVAKAVGCASVEEDLRSHPEKVLECLRQKSADELLLTSIELASPLITPFVPTFGDEFCPKAPVLSINKGEFNNLDLLLGTTDDECTMFFLFEYLDFLASDLKNYSVSDVLQITMKVMKQWNIDMPKDAFELYTESIDSSDKTALRNIMIDYFSDYFFTCPVNYFSERYSDQGNNVYLYRFSHISEKSHLPEWTGVPHYFEVPFVFGRPLSLRESYTDEDREFSLQVMKIFTAFARTGVPELPDGMEWPKFNRKSEQYVDLKYRNINIFKSLRKRQCEFLRKYM